MADKPAAIDRALMPETFQGGLFRHGFLLLVATQIGGVATLLFQLIMMRRLPVTEYGVMASMLSLVLVMGTPMEALRSAVAHQTAWLMRQGKRDAITNCLLIWGRALLLSAAVIGAITFLGAPRIADFFQLPSAMLVVLTGGIIAGGLFMPFFAGALQGLQSFVWMAVHGQVWGVTRLIAAVLLLGWAANTAMTALWAQAAGVVASIAVGLYALIRIRPGVTGTSNESFAGWSYFLWSLCVLSGYAIIMNADVALVKRFFEPEEAGLFARAATIGRTIVFLPVPVAAAMFPKVVSAGLSSAMDRSILLKAIVFTLVLIVVAGGLFTLGAGLIWRFFTGESADPETLRLVRLVIWALAPLGLTFLLVNFEIAQRRFRVPSVLVLLAVCYIAAVTARHETLDQVIGALAIVSVSSLLLIGTDMLRASWRSRPCASD